MPGKKKFPDLTGDGKVTKKDILKARGVPGFKKGGEAKGGMVLEIGLRPATKSEMKMAKEMKPQKKAGGGMARKDKDDAKALKGIEKQQESQAKRAQQAHKDVREYSRQKARVRGLGSAISGKNFKGVF